MNFIILNFVKLKYSLSLWKEVGQEFLNILKINKSVGPIYKLFKLQKQALVRIITGNIY